MQDLNQKERRARPQSRSSTWAAPSLASPSKQRSAKPLSAKLGFRRLSKGLVYSGGPLGDCAVDQRQRRKRRSLGGVRRRAQRTSAPKKRSARSAAPTERHDGAATDSSSSKNSVGSGSGLNQTRSAMGELAAAANFTHPALAAYEQGTLGLSFGGAGCEHRPLAATAAAAWIALLCLSEGVAAGCCRRKRAGSTRPRPEFVLVAAAGAPVASKP